MSERERERERERELADSGNALDDTAIRTKCMKMSLKFHIFMHENEMEVSYFLRVSLIWPISIYRYP